MNECLPIPGPYHDKDAVFENRSDRGGKQCLEWSCSVSKKDTPRKAVARAERALQVESSLERLPFRDETVATNFFVKPILVQIIG